MNTEIVAEKKESMRTVLCVVIVGLFGLGKSFRFCVIFACTSVLVYITCLSNVFTL